MSRIQGGLQAPIANNNEGRNFHSSYDLPDEGIHQAILIGLVVMGTYKESFGNEEPKERKKVALIWEFPSIKQLVYEDDTEKKSFRKSQTMGYSMHEKSNFIKVVNALCNGQYTSAEIQKLDLFTLVGNRAILGVSHHTINKDGEEKRVLNIDSYSRVGKMPLPDDWAPENERFMWFPDANGDNFDTENFAELPRWLREKIMESKEAIAHKQRGGTFAEHKAVETQERKSQPQTPQNPNAPKVPNGYEFVDVTNSGVGYIAYREAGWTDKNLLDKGFLKKLPKAEPAVPAPPVADTPPPPPVPAAPAAPAPTESNNGDFDPFAEDDDDLPY